jgi:hypothetical protein
VLVARRIPVGLLGESIFIEGAAGVGASLLLSPDELRLEPIRLNRFLNGLPFDRAHRSR